MEKVQKKDGIFFLQKAEIKFGKLSGMDGKRGAFPDTKGI